MIGGNAPRSPNGAGTAAGKPLALRVMAEYSSSGIWVIGGGFKPFRHGMIEHNELDLPGELARRFDAWIEAYETLSGEQVPEFNRTGLALASDLKRTLGGGVYVEFANEDAGGGLGETVVVP